MEAPLDLKALGGRAVNEETTKGAVGGPNLEHPFPAPLVTLVTTETLQEHSVLPLPASIPPQLKASAMPPIAEETNWDRLNAQLKKPSVIFNNDDRTLFIPQGYPWQCVGKVVTAGGWGSGTVVGPRHILTASHVVNWQPDGSAGWITFTPGYYDGRGNSGELAVNEVISWEKAPKFLTDEQVAFDYVILITNVRIGETLGTVGTRAYDASWNKLPNFQAIGYPAEISGGQRPAIQINSSIQTKEDHPLNGNTGSCLGNFNDFTPGQSGGPVWGWWSGEVGPSAVGVGSIIGTTNVANPGDTRSDNDYAGGDALLKIVKWAKANRP